MAAKTEAKEAPAAPAPEKAAEAAPAPAAKSSFKAWIPALVAIVAAPAASFAVAEYVLLPRLAAKLAAAPVEVASPEMAATEGSSGESKGDGKKGKGEKEGASANFEYTNLVVNLAGTMGTRYLKTSFIVTGVNGAPTKTVFEGQKAKLTDITLNVLSSLSLADLEEPGSKNVLREKLVATYNQALGKRTVDQVYFSDFVIQ
jgi:flagellar FliL protein